MQLSLVCILIASALSLTSANPYFGGEGWSHHDMSMTSWDMTGTMRHKGSILEAMRNDEKKRFSRLVKFIDKCHLAESLKKELEREDKRFIYFAATDAAISELVERGDEPMPFLGSEPRKDEDELCQYMEQLQLNMHHVPGHWNMNDLLFYHLIDQVDPLQAPTPLLQSGRLLVTRVTQKEKSPDEHHHHISYPVPVMIAQCPLIPGLLVGHTSHWARVATGGLLYADSGLVVPITRVLTPPTNILLALRKSSGWSMVGTFLTALHVAEMTEQVQNTPGLTVFVPSDQAWMRLGGVARRFLFETEMGRQMLKRILKYHIVKSHVEDWQPESHMSAPIRYSYTFPTGESEFKTAIGDKRSIFKYPSLVPHEHANLIVDKATRVIIPDLLFAEGVIHVVDEVMFPPGVFDEMQMAIKEHA